MTLFRLRARKAAFVAILSLVIVSCSSSITPEPLIGRAWIRTDQTELPGEMLLFLKDGTVLMDSCWETYRLATWKQTSDNKLIFVEDQMETPVELLKLTADELHIRLELPREMRERRFRYQRSPYLCPDMKR